MCIRYHRRKIKFSCKAIQKDGNNVNYQKKHNVLFNKHNDQVLKKGSFMLMAVWKVTKKSNGLSYAYHNRKVCEDGITTNHQIFKSKLCYNIEQYFR